MHRLMNGGVGITESLYNRGRLTSFDNLHALLFMKVRSSRPSPAALKWC